MLSLCNRLCQGALAFAAQAGANPAVGQNRMQRGGGILSGTDQEAPAVSNLPAPVHIGQNEREGLPEEEQTKAWFALGSKAGRWSTSGGMSGERRAMGAAE